MKKIIAIILALVMCLSLAACGGDKPQPNSDDPVSNSGEPISDSSEPSSESTAPSESQSNAPVGEEDFSKEKDFNKLDVTGVERICDMEVTGMKMSKEKYDVDEPITVTVTWNGTPASDTWIGIIPAETPHGTEEVNDDFDIDYFYFEEKASGDSFTFEELGLEKGDYTIRINESDAGGAELAWCEFSVK